MKYKGLIVYILIFILSYFTCINASAMEMYYYDGMWHPASSVSLYFQDKKIQCDVPPLIIDGRTLVPVRAVFETLGADVKWDERKSEVKIEKNNLQVKLTIDSITAYVNGSPKTLDVPAKIVEDSSKRGRTLVPVRFISESIGYDVVWNEKDSSVVINNENSDKVITKITNTVLDGNDIVEIFTKSGEYPEISFLSSPDRLVADFVNHELSIPDGATNKPGNYVANVRWANHPGKYARIVVDLTEKPSYLIERDDGKFRIVLYSEENKPKPDVNKSKLVVIDPGHGGSDPGAIGYKDDNIDLMEKDANLDIALKVYNMLLSEGVNVVITRKTDVFVGLTERAEMANDLGASLFVSVHNNSFTNPDVSGSMVFFCDSEEEIEKYGFSGKELARIIQNELSKLQTKDRSIADGSRYVVLYKTSMPAVIVEGAFLSNEGDRELLKTDSFRTEMAKAITKGILNALDKLK